MWEEAGTAWGRHGQFCLTQQQLETPHSAPKLQPVRGAHGPQMSLRKGGSCQRQEIHVDSPENLCEDTPKKTQEETCRRGDLLGTQLEMHSWKEVLCDRERTLLRGLWPVGHPCQRQDAPEGLQPHSPTLGEGHPQRD